MIKKRPFCEALIYLAFGAFLTWLFQDPDAIWNFFIVVIFYRILLLETKQ